MTMLDAPSDRDYAEYLNPQEPEPEDPENIAPECEPEERPEFGPFDVPF